MDFLSQLINLTKLNLSHANISNGDSLTDLYYLQDLSLNSLSFTDYQFFKHLRELKTLSLRDCSTDHLDFFSYLKNIETLVFSHNKVNDWSPLALLTHLKSLTLDDSNFHDISIIKKAKKLTHLCIVGAAIDDISLLSELSQLKYITLSNNNISNIDVFSQLPHLKFLWLYGNTIQDFSVFNRFISPKKLQELSLGNTSVRDIGFLDQFVNLQTLHLQNNSITNIEPLANLNQLNILILKNNLITSLSALKSLKRLSCLDLHTNPIIELPPWITKLNLSLNWNQKKFMNGSITLFDNPLVSPPPEIIQQGNQAIDDYFDSIKGKETAKLNEVKVILVGEGMAGKTSILKRFQGLDFDSEESQTHGINVATINVGDIPDLEVGNELKHCRLHFWDFGGQEIMHASHQFFMSERALYILVLDSRTDSKKYYWLKHIEKLAGNSPILLLMNKVQKAFSEMETSHQENNRELQLSTFERLSNFVDYLQDKDSKINKAFSLISKGKDKAQKLATNYNKIAAYFGLPNVPDAFL